MMIFVVAVAVVLLLLLMMLLLMMMMMTMMMMTMRYPQTMQRQVFVFPSTLLALDSLHHCPLRPKKTTETYEKRGVKDENVV